MGCSRTIYFWCNIKIFFKYDSSGHLIDSKFANSLWATIKAMEKLIPNQKEWTKILIEIMNLIIEYKDFIQTEHLGISNINSDILNNKIKSEVL